jgi:hypothetical protein
MNRLQKTSRSTSKLSCPKRLGHSWSSADARTAGRWSRHLRYISVSKGQARQKTDTADEKKLHKINVKKEREMDDCCDDGWRDGIKDGLSLGFELGFVEGSDNGW